MKFDLATTDHLLETTRAVRKRLDLSRPVERDVLERCLELALQAPTGSNRQHWRWVVVSDAATRVKLAELYRRAADPYLGPARDQALAAGNAGTARVLDSARYLAAHLHEVPVHVIPCLQQDFGPDCRPGMAPIGAMSSILPAVWSFQLALRSRGLGSCLTTLHLRYASEAATLLGLPADVHQVALLPVAYTLGTDFKRAQRRPMDEVVHWERWSD